MAARSRATLKHRSRRSNHFLAMDLFKIPASPPPWKLLADKYGITVEKQADETTFKAIGPNKEIVHGDTASQAVNAMVIQCKLPGWEQIAQFKK